MIKGGKGGANTLTGLKFEKKMELRTVLNKTADFSVLGDDVFFKGEKVAILYQEHKLYKNLLEPKGVNYSDIISKKLLPDDAILVLKKNTLFILEKKFQEVSGSVDEKLQTCDFKNRQYKKLLEPLGITVKYIYILSSWFKHKGYKDVLDYVERNGCYYFFEEIPLKFLGLSN